MDQILVEHLTKDYGHNRGIFDVSISVKKGETLGFLGPNGAGKTTTLRHLMGFSKPQSGSAKIMGLDCSTQYDIIKTHIGYLPGEVSLPAGLDGYEFIKMMEGLRKNKNEKRVRYLLDKFKLNPNQNVKKMSIGEKRKIAIVTAFMSDPDILLLDEPTSGLDPIMQETFIEFIKEEKSRGKTILLSSHIFQEVEALCDSIVIIKDGKIISTLNSSDVKQGLKKTFQIEFMDSTMCDSFISEGFIVNKLNDKTISIQIDDKKTNEFIKSICKYSVNNFNETTTSLEDYFMHFYKIDHRFGGVH